MSDASATAKSQAQSTSAEKDQVKRNKPEEQDEIQHFDTTITKLVERENADGETEWVEVMSDNLYPGERLKRAENEEKQARKDELARAKAQDAATKRSETEEEILKAKRDADKKAK